MMTQRALAFRLGVKPATVNGKISGRTAWNLDELRELSSIFEVSADYLMGKEPIESAEPVNAKSPGPACD
jgi:transcriptional regulator with XRE-family HTH domain